MNKYLKTIVIATVTSTSKSYPIRAGIKHNKTKAWVIIDQVRTIDKKRIIKILCTLTEKELYTVKSVI